MIELYIALISAGIPAIVTLITHFVSQKTNKRHSAKQSILQMMMEDVISVELLHKLPYNHSNIYYEYDIYHKNGGNSDMDIKLKEYEEWYDKIEKEK